MDRPRRVDINFVKIQCVFKNLLRITKPYKNYLNFLS